ncbi:DUF6120 family protein [[Clostridium] innocuum]|uniref:DUF6120 family protein n=1 Tax=Clostridium innocuum TaxID=1522 RepID=UPI000D7A53B9|nr:DUF6120 family protein [[Clostridium] innocuum]MCR0315268.1 DUF6120 family protein [[Clostridium] innocuum]MCR0369710.1 DUF6120 family protein [[Clostridium] innocuum]MCR0374778.1 DUF6120 family protein [[Clostridium] innocuum]MCR0559663.1 DUF6120 family protein [[Clostridium] innocuum]MCR0602643.1 DUF6120 family protein [[Clostridium] innocuum]
MKSGKERYRQEVRYLLPFIGREEKSFLDNFMCNIEDVSYNEIVEEWGTPISVVHAYLEEQDTGKLINELTRRRTIKWVLAAIAISVMVITLIYCIFLYKSYEDVKKTMPDEVSETLVVEE